MCIMFYNVHNMFQCLNTFHILPLLYMQCFIIVHTLWCSVPFWIWVFLHNVFTLFHFDLTMFTGTAFALPNLVMGSTCAELEVRSLKPCLFHFSFQKSKNAPASSCIFDMTMEANTNKCTFFRAICLLAMVMHQPASYGLRISPESIPFCFDWGESTDFFYSFPLPKKMFSSALWVCANIHYLHG